MIYDENTALYCMQAIDELRKEPIHNNGKRRRILKLTRKLKRWLERSRTIGHVTPASITQYLEKLDTTKEPLTTDAQPVKANIVGLSTKDGQR